MFRKFLFFIMFITFCAQTTFGAAPQPTITTQINEQLFDVFGLTGTDRNINGLGIRLCEITKLNQRLDMHVIFKGYSQYLIAGWKKLCATEANNERCTYITQIESSLTGLLNLIQIQSPENAAIIAIEELIQKLEQKRPHVFGSLECKLHFDLQELQFQREKILADNTESKNNYEEKFLAILGFNTDTTSLIEITNKICLMTGFDPELFSPIFCGFLGTLHWNIICIDDVINNPEKFETYQYAYDQLLAHYSFVYEALNTLSSMTIVPEGTNALWNETSRLKIGLKTLAIELTRHIKLLSPQ